MSREKVLSLLLEQGDRYVSGEAMSRTLGISRAAVWKAIEALRQEGYVIQSAPNRGYHLETAPDRVREGELSRPPVRPPGGGDTCCAWKRWTPLIPRPNVRLWPARRTAW